MTTDKKILDSTEQMPLRILPGIIIVLLQWIIRFALPLIVPGTEVYGIFGGLLGGIAIIVWWAFFSRASQVDRWGANVLMIAALFVASRFIDESISTGAQGMMFIIFSIPVLSLAFIIWAVASRNASLRMRRLTMIITILIACGGWTLIRTDGITGDFKLDLAWRWSKTSEDYLLEQGIDETSKYFSAPVTLNNHAEWPGFRGPNRDGIVTGININTDWKTTPPEEMWRQPIGPGCSSFAISGNLFFTQEQRGEKEIVSSYTIKTGKPVWMHEDSARFWDSHAGAGPRSTPTFHNGIIYTLGATGVLNALNATDGRVIWSRNAVADTNKKHSGWGYSSSPLVLEDHVIIAVVGQLVAYDIETGNPSWFGPDGGDSYSSPHLLTIDGIKQIVLLSGKGATSVLPSDGKVLWKYAWEGDSRIVQPALTPEGELLICNSDGSSLRCISVLQENGAWSFQERWTSTYLKPNFNDFIIHEGHAYGYNGPLLVCIDLKNGERKWKSSRYGGQILLFADQDILLVISEKGELSLVKAIPDQFEEIARLDAIEGKTWNHPAMAGDILLVRNSQEMVGYRLQ
jgi:outer membrane protein assembly factor BamB